MHRTNYSGLAPSLLEDLYRTRYLQRLSGEEHMRVVTMTEVVETRASRGEIVLDLRDRMSGAIHQLSCDVVLLGSGYARQPPALVRHLASKLGCERIEVARDYRVLLEREGEGAVYLQGVNEDTHGIADSLLSLLAHRSQEIVNDIMARRHQLMSLRLPG
jgi:L-ornithine N5-oxygenase